jgi:hypothetical protein
MILFLLQKNIKDFTVNVGQLFVPSLECFAMVYRSKNYSVFYYIFSARIYLKDI